MIRSSSSISSSAELVELLELAAALVELDDREALRAAELVPGLAERGRRVPDPPPAGRVEAGAVAEHAPDLLVLPRRHVLEHVEQVVRDLHAVDRAPQQPDRVGEVAVGHALRRRLDLEPAQLQPELRRLVDGLEEQLVAVHHLLGVLLEREQVVGAQVALVVAAAAAAGGSAWCSPRCAIARSILRAWGISSRTRRSSGCRPSRRSRARVRPRSLDEVVGQRHALGEGSALRLAILEDRVAVADPLRAAREREDDARAGGRGDDRRRVRGALGGLGHGGGRARGARAGARAARRLRAGARSSSSTRSTGSTRPSRTRCSRASRRGC